MQHERTLLQCLIRAMWNSKHDFIRAHDQALYHAARYYAAQYEGFRALIRKVAGV